MPISKSQHAKLIQLGAKVKSTRNNKNLTLKELGHLIDKEPQSISRIEMGDINPSYLYLLKLCKGLKIKLADIAPES